MRSYLFVPGDSPRKMEKALGSGADALILDLEDSVAADSKDAARDTVAGFLADQQASAGRPRLFVRVNPFDSDRTGADVGAVTQGRPDGIVLPKADGGASVQRLDGILRVAEAEAGLDDGGIRILPIATETAASLFTLGSYRGASPRLSAMTWGAEDLSADIGARVSRDADGLLTEPFRIVRSLCLFGACAAGVEPIDSVFVDFRDDEGLRAESVEAARDGFTGKLAIHPGQVATINAAFTPSAADIEEAEAVITALKSSASGGVASLNGKMIDRPHQIRAERTLARARQAGLSVSGT